MRPALCVYTLFGKDGKPQFCGVLDVNSGESDCLTLFAKHNTELVSTVEHQIKAVAGIIDDLSLAGKPVAISDFKAHLASFPLQAGQRPYEVYDCCAPEQPVVADSKAMIKLVKRQLHQMAHVDLPVWQRVFANAAVVYQDLQRRGVTIHGQVCHPLWSQRTWSGRSKTRGVNIQGMTAADGLRRLNPCFIDEFIHFDWVAADVLVASLLSGDEILQRTFEYSDPYTAMVEMIKQLGGTIDRADCKVALLKAINSLKPSEDTIGVFFPRLCEWLVECEYRIGDQGYSDSILGRRFHLADARDQNPRAVLNAMLQGSVAQAMQCAVRRVWEHWPEELLLEIHDSMVLCCDALNLDYVAAIIDDVVDIMTHPFRGVLASNPFFPVKVSVGRQFRRWDALKVFRNNGQAAAASS